MADINALSRALNRGSEAEGRLAGLDEQYEQARKGQVGQTSQDRYGQVSPLSVMADILRQSKSRRDLRELAPQRTAARQSMAENKNALPLYSAQVSADKAVQDQTNFETTATAKVNAANALTKARQAQAAKLAATNKQAALLKASATATAQNAPEAWVNPDGSGLTTGSMTDQGFVDAEGKPLNLAGKIPYKEYSQQINAVKKAKLKAAGKSGKDGDPLDKVGDPDLVSQVLDDPLLEESTGILDPKRWAGKFGYSLPGAPENEGEEIQALHSKMSDIGIDSVKTNLKGLGVNPTDKDLEVAFASIPDAGTQPLGWAIWARDQYLPMLKKAGAEAIADGTGKKAEIEAYVNAVEASTEKALSTYGDSSDSSTQKPKLRPTTEMSLEELQAELNNG